MGEPENDFVWAQRLIPPLTIADCAAHERIAAALQQAHAKALSEGWDAAIAALRSHSRADYSTESPKHLAHWLGTYRALKSTARPEYMQLFLSQGEIERFRGLLETQSDHPHPDDAGLMRKLTTMRDNLAKTGARTTQTPREAAEEVAKDLLASGIPSLIAEENRYKRWMDWLANGIEAAFAARDRALLEEKACTMDVELVSGAMGEGRAEGFKAGMEFALAEDEALIEAITEGILDAMDADNDDQGQFSGPMPRQRYRKGIRGYARAALAAARRHRGVE